MLVTIDQIDSFRPVGDWPASAISESVLQTVAGLDKRSELEP
jgi:hypothetical protein